MLAFFKYNQLYILNELPSNKTALTECLFVTCLFKLDKYLNKNQWLLTRLTASNNQGPDQAYWAI